jgi:hypothetical protein
MEDEEGGEHEAEAPRPERRAALAGVERRASAT